MIIDRQKWLEERRKGIGGSDAAAIIGLNKYVTPYALWADKTGRLPEREDTEAMRQGRDLEDYVAKRFCEKTNLKTRRCNMILKNPDYPFALANVDRLIVGEKAGLECKTTSVLNLKRFKNGEYPDEYYVQCVHYMAVTGYSKWYLAVLVLNNDFMVFEIKRDEEEIVALMNAEKEFWDEYVVKDIPPDPDGLKSTTEVINRIYPDALDSETDISHLHSEIEHIQALKGQIKVLEKTKELSEQKIKLEMGSSSIGYCGVYTVKWGEQSRESVDKKLLLREHPEIDLKPILKISNFRKFEIKEIKEAK